MPTRPLALACLLALAAGCSGSKPAPVPVTGSVSVAGKVPEGALVRLHPVGGPPDAAKPLGYVQADGSFQLTTERENDGAIPGRYTVTVEWRKKKKSQLEPDGPDQLAGRYATVEKSKIEVTVGPGPTALAAIELAAK